MEKWTEAFAASDVDAIVNLNAPDALFMGTGNKTVVTHPAAIRKYFEDALLTRRPARPPSVHRKSWFCQTPPLSSQG